MDIAQKILMTITYEPDLLKKVVNHWNQSPILPIEASRREKNTSRSVKCEGFAHWFLQLQWRGAS